MEKSRLETLEEFLAANPNDAFVRYGLAQEYLKQGRAEQAVEQFQAILECNAEYKAAYYHLGQALERLGRLEEAREAYRRGIEVTTRLADLHTRSELQTALDLLG
jgi:tetratricopeptide (TPR) repeat protein